MICWNRTLYLFHTIPSVRCNTSWICFFQTYSNGKKIWTKHHKAYVALNYSETCLRGTFKYPLECPCIMYLGVHSSDISLIGKWKNLSKYPMMNVCPLNWVSIADRFYCVYVQRSHMTFCNETCVKHQTFCKHDSWTITIILSKWNVLQKSVFVDQQLFV